MKKLSVLVLASVLLTSMSLTSCDKNDEFTKGGNGGGVNGGGLSFEQESFSKTNSANQLNETSAGSETATGTN